MSVGHVARTFEAAGIATVAIFIRALKHHAFNLKAPRVLVTPHLMGRTVGPPNDVERQTQVVRAALSLLTSAKAPGAIVDFLAEAVDAAPTTSQQSVSSASTGRTLSV